MSMRHEVPPVVVVFEGWEQWQRTATTITISAAADKQIRRLSLLRFGLTTQAAQGARAHSTQILILP